MSGRWPGQSKICVHTYFAGWESVQYVLLNEINAAFGTFTRQIGSGQSDRQARAAVDKLRLPGGDQNL
jgi:hypothetical protein